MARLKLLVVAGLLSGLIAVIAFVNSAWLAGTFLSVCCYTCIRQAMVT